MANTYHLETQPLQPISPAPPRDPSRSQSPSPHSTTPNIPSPQGMSKSQAWNLYTSHALSTWNARTYEFAAIIFTAAAYPDTLVASSLRGIATTLASISLSSALGRWIDAHPSRLKTLMTTISLNRASVLLACCLWGVIVSSGEEEEEGWKGRDGDLIQGGSVGVVGVKGGLFAMVVLLGVVEKLSGAGNMMAMEREWVVCLAAPLGERYDLTRLNSAMRRIDLVCKLVAPLVISAFVEVLGTRGGAVAVGGLSAGCWGVEYWCARRVWNTNEKLREPKTRFGHVVGHDIDVGISHKTEGSSWDCLEQSKLFMQRYIKDFRLYFSTKVWIPSMALSLLHLSVLSYSATFITYLLSVGFSLSLITIARAAGSLVEISSTIVTPFGVQYLGKHSPQGDYPRTSYGLIQSEGIELPTEENDIVDNIADDPTKQTEKGLQRLGLWGITWQLLNLIPVVFTLWFLSSSNSASTLKATTTSPTTALPLFAFLSFSRLGLWIFDLSTQQLTQTLVPASFRSSFAGVENSFAAFFELGNFVAALLWSRPQDFKYLALGSGIAVAVAAVAYATWVRGVRGHLVHWDKVGGKCGCGREK